MIDLEKRDKIESNTQNHVHDNVAGPRLGEQSIHGWLVLFLISVGLGGLLTLVLSLRGFNMGDYDNNYFLAAADVLDAIGCFSLACYIIYAFYSKKPNAVFLGKSYLVIIFLGNALSLMMGLGDEGRGLGSTYQMVRSLIWGVIWFFYLIKSDQVNNIFPQTHRKVTKKDWTVVISVVLVPFVCLVLGFASIGLESLFEPTYAGLSGTKEYGISSTNDNLFTDSDCSINEVTDGRVIFEKPGDDFIPSDSLFYIDEATPVFQFYNSNSFITICSGWEKDFSKETFEQYWVGWKDEDFDSYDVRIKTDEPIKVNGNEGYCKAVNISGIDVYVNWEFVLLHNDYTEKIFLLSYYSNQQLSSRTVDSILNSVRFEKQ